MKKINLKILNKNLNSQGYSVIKNFIQKTKINKIKNILNSKNRFKKSTSFHGGAEMIYNLQNIDYEFIKIIFNKNINEICKQYFKKGSHYLDKSVFQFDSMHSRILPGVLKSQDLHIDSRICGVSPPTHLHFFLYLSDVNEIDGPTQVVPCSHKVEKFPKNSDKKKAKKIIGKAGTMIVMNSSIWHGSALKSSKLPRTIITLSYSRWHIRQTFAVPYSLPDKILKKLNKIQKKIMGFENYPSKDEKQRVTMRGKLENLTRK
jgi:ectoine hydroxylase-related dioxygenase (phytanoyl-CoA dioxygenase family)